jgi:hypothetical protein
MYSLIFVVLHLRLFIVISATSSSWDTTPIRAEYIIIEDNFEYIQMSFAPGVNLGDIYNCKLLIDCAKMCVANEICLTATYYSDENKCSLLSENSNYGGRSSLTTASIISLADRGK